MYALPAQVCRFVEAVRLAAPRTLDAYERFDDRTLRRSAPSGEIQPGTFACDQTAKPNDAYGNTHGERAAASRARNLEPRGKDAPNLGQERTVVERPQPEASPPQAGERERSTEEKHALLTTD